MEEREWFVDRERRGTRERGRRRRGRGNVKNGLDGWVGGSVFFLFLFCFVLFCFWKRKGENNYL